MEEKVILRVHQSGAKRVAVISGIAVAVLVFVVCLLSFDPRYYADTSIVGAAVSGVVVGIIVAKWLSGMELVVTDKRVYGAAAFGKRVDLPLDSITAIGTGWFQTVSITTPSGAIKFMLMPNHSEIHATISKLLIERQQKNNITEMPTQGSNAEELKKYKDLLDSGVISQEEFDAKKKQLLGV